MYDNTGEILPRLINLKMLHLSISQIFPDAGGHDKLVMEMLQNIQDGMLTCLECACACVTISPLPASQHGSCSVWALGLQVAICLLSQEKTRERGPSRDEKYHDGRLPLHLPALHHLFDLRNSDTNSFPQKIIMQLVVMVTRASGFRG